MPRPPRVLRPHRHVISFRPTDAVRRTIDATRASLARGGRVVSYAAALHYLVVAADRNSHEAVHREAWMAGFRAGYVEFLRRVRGLAASMSGEESGE